MTDTTGGALASTTARSSLDRYSALAIFVLALAVRFLFIFLGDVLGLSEPPNPDTFIYQDVARDVLSGKAYNPPESGCLAGHFLVAPLFPLFLAGVYKLFGFSNLVALVVQATLGAVTALLVAVTAGKLFGRRAFLIGGLLAATQPYLIMQAGELVTEVLFVFLYVGALSLYVMPLAQERNEVRSLLWSPGTLAAVGSGAVLGAAMLCRPTPLFGTPILIAALALVGRGRPVRVRLLRAALLTLAMMLVIGPWILGIHSACGVWVPIATSGEFILYASNAPGWAEQVVLNEESDSSHSVREYYRLLGEHPPGWFARRAREVITQDVGRFARLCLVRAKQFFKFLPERRGPPIRFLLALWHYTILFPLGIIGLAVAVCRRQPFAWAMLPFLAVMCLLHVVSVPNMRYRAATLDVVLLIFVTGLVARIMMRARKRPDY